MISWPERYAPGKTSVHVRNELEMDSSPETVWAWLIRAPLWPTWYSNSANVSIEGGGTDLKAGSEFHWRTFGVNLTSKVEEFSPFERLAWSARGTGIDAYHAWLIEPTEGGCHVLTEETQIGFLPRLNNLARPNHMSRWHQNWLEGLRSQARKGLP
jgi:Polyketide cyclase / dehydrase and lipid transport